MMYKIFLIIPALFLLVGCNQTQQAQLQVAAAISCQAAIVAAGAAVQITADINSGKTNPGQSQKDAALAQKLTTDACTALSKLPTVIQTQQTAPVNVTVSTTAAPVPTK